MKLPSKKSSATAAVGLDLEAGSIAATELGGNARIAGSAKVAKAAVGEMAPGAFAEGEVVDAVALAGSLKNFFDEHGFDKNVRLGIANQMVTVRIIRLPFVEDPDALNNAIRFKAQDEIPMPLDQAVLDHRVVAHSRSEEGNRQVDALVVAARREMINGFLTATREAGLKPVGVDLAAFGMIRALVERVPPTEPGADKPHVPGTLYCGIGDGTNMAFARGRSCLFTRNSTYGSEEIAADLAGRAQIDQIDARDWLVYSGLDRPLEELAVDDERQPILLAARETLETGARRLLDEIRPSIDYYSQLPDVPRIERLVIGGTGTSIPGLAEHLAGGLGLELREARPAALADRDQVTAARLATSYGLALEE